MAPAYRFLAKSTPPTGALLSVMGNVSVAGNVAVPSRQGKTTAANETDAGVVLTPLLLMSPHSTLTQQSAG